MHDSYDCRAQNCNWNCHKSTNNILILITGSHQLARLFSSSLVTFLHKKNKKCPVENPHWPPAQKLNETPVCVDDQELLQYRSEISGLHTRKTHAQLLRKCVLKNALLSTRLRAFVRIWCACFLLFTLINGILLLLSTKGKTKGSSHC